VNEQESREAIEAAVDFAFVAPPTAWFEIGKRLEHRVYAYRGDKEQELIGRFTNIVVDAIHAARDEHGKICLAWAWVPECSPHTVSLPYTDIDGTKIPEHIHQEEGFKIFMRFVLFDQDLNTIQIAEHLVKAEGEPIKWLTDAES